MEGTVAIRHKHRIEVMLHQQRWWPARIAGTALTLLIVLSFSNVVNKAYAQSECSLEPGADDCSGAPTDPGSTGSSASGATGTSFRGASRYVGNPIDAISGNKYQRGDDYAAFSSPLIYSRHYNTALVTQNLGLGRGWRDTYSLRLYQEADNAYRLIQSDGKTLFFSLKSGSSSLYTTENPDDGELSIGANTQWRIADGRVWAFVGSYPVSLSFADGQRLSLRYRHERLHTVTDDKGQVLRYFYSAGRRGLARFADDHAGDQPGHLRCLLLPDGSGVRFGYDEKMNLTSVRHADGIDWQYGYSNATFPNHLTRAVRRRPQQRTPWGCEESPLPDPSPTSANADSAPWISEWRYDDAGRANLWHTQPSERQVRVEHDKAYPFDESLEMESLRQGITYNGANPNQVWGSEVTDSHTQKTARYVHLQSQEEHSASVIVVQTRRCSNCDWEVVHAARHSRKLSAAQNAHTQTVNELRQALADGLAAVGLPIQTTRFGAAVLTLPPVLHPAFAANAGTADNTFSAVRRAILSQNEAINSVRATQNDSANACVALAGTFAAVAATFHHSDPIPMLTTRGKVFGSPEPRPIGHCPLPEGVDCDFLADAIVYAELSACAYDTSTCPEPWEIIDPASIGLNPNDFEQDGFFAVLLYHPGRRQTLKIFTTLVILSNMKSPQNCLMMSPAQSGKQTRLLR